MAAADAGPGTAVPVDLRRERRMVCVEYPGVVRDVSKMLPTLGGEEGVSRIYADPTKRLELYFRPKDPYCHPVCANRFSTSSLLLRIRRKTKRPRGVPGPGARPEVTFDIEMLGVISTVYKFQGMSDFQYLAVHTEAGGRCMSMYDKVLMLKPEKETFFHQELPLYIPPPIFSRLDTPVDYFYRPETQHREGYNNPPVSGENLIGLSRARRPHNAIFVNFEEDEVPVRPLEAAVQTWRRISTNPVDRKAEEELRKLFEIRPIWSRNAVKANISVHPDKLKVLLPFVAYYMVSASLACHLGSQGCPGLWCGLSATAKLGAVYTEGGFVEGVNKKLSLFGNYVDIFKGIPFAAAPKPLENPQRHPGWQGTLKAKDFKKRCLQATITQDSTYGEEDCLYLNIWVPQGKREVSRNLPVMVWIYGGAFLMGAGHGANFLSNYLYDGLPQHRGRQPARSASCLGHGVGGEHSPDPVNSEPRGDAPHARTAPDGPPGNPIYGARELGWTVRCRGPLAADRKEMARQTGRQAGRGGPREAQGSWGQGAQEKRQKRGAWGA
uniref:General transcription factor 3C polypeptide 5 n=1 Tax=Suricata suricatta TaxID=37032 RepID=A0A673VGJ6_SURSU